MIYLLHAGNDIWLAPISVLGVTISPDNATVVKQLRNASHNILYMTANSNLVDDSYRAEAGVSVTFSDRTDIPAWKIGFYGVFNGVVLLLLGFSVYRFIQKIRYNE